MHWSLDNGHHHGRNINFSEYLSKHLELYRANKDTNLRQYAMLPNFWNGYRPPEAEFEIGNVEITRLVQGANSKMRIIIQNETSGTCEENHIICDVTKQYVLRSLRRTITFAEGAGEEHKLHMEILPQTALLHNWVLAEFFSELCIDNKLPDLLINGDYVAKDIRVNPLPTDSCLVGGISLSGYCVYGEALEPSYWWVDSIGEVVVISTTFITYVATGGEVIG